jgi:S-formylglutathione hydrolase FrmB
MFHSVPRQDAAKEGIAILFPDTSPRGAGIEGEDDDWDFGTGAGFYINATHEKVSEKDAIAIDIIRDHVLS